MGPRDDRSVLERYPLRQIYFYLTSGCNLNCRHCWIEPEFGRTDATELPVELFDAIVAQARPLGLKAVKLTGGEPLLHSRIDELLERVRDSRLRLVAETNGLLLTPGRARLIAACERPFVSVSVDGADAETHDAIRGVAGAFQGALAGVTMLVEAGLRPQLIMTVMRRNREQLEGVARLAEALGAGSVKFNLLHPVARGRRAHAAGEALDALELLELGRWVERELAPRSRLRMVFSHPLAFRPLSRLFGGEADGCGVCEVKSVLGVLADGSYALCGIGATSPELVFGHASRDRLDTVWREHETINRIRREAPERLEGACQACLMKRVCLGYCLALNYSRTGDLFAPCWFCQEALERGAFPESRRGEAGPGRASED